MRTNRISRLVCVLLACLMLLPIVACGKTEGDAPTTTTAVDGTAATTTAAQTSHETTLPAETEHTDENGYERDDLDPALHFGDKTVNLLHWNDAEHEEFVAETANGELINDAIYTRNQTIEDRLGVKLNFIGTAGDTNNEEPFALKLSTSISAGDHVYDLISAYSYTTGMCAARNLLYDLSSVDHLDFEKPWWPKLLIDQCTINNKLLFVSGDASANVIYTMYVTFFNKDLLQANKLEDPSKLVAEGKWTIDKQFEMCKGVYSDLNGNGVKDVGDQSGLYIYTLHFDAFLWGSNIFIVDSMGDNFKFADDFLGEKTVNLQEKIKSFIYDTNDGFLTTDKANNHLFFGEGLSLFWNDRCHRAILYTADNVSYGILPIPKYNEEQEGHITLLGNTFSLYGIPQDSQDPDFAGAVLECWASESYRTVTPAVYELSFKYKYSQDDVSAQMFDLARSTVVLDLARIFSNSLGAYKSWQKAITGSAGWASTVKANEKPWNNQLDKLRGIFE